MCGFKYFFLASLDTLYIGFKYFVRQNTHTHIYIYMKTNETHSIFPFHHVSAVFFRFSLLTYYYLFSLRLFLFLSIDWNENS